MSVSATHSNPSLDIFERLTPLTTEPFNRRPEAGKLPEKNHFGWVESFFSLVQLEKDIDFSQMDPETIQKVQEAFDRFLDSMVDLGFDVNKGLAWQDVKPMHKAAEKGCLMILNALIRKGADVNAYTFDTWGDTPLYSAVTPDHLTAAQLLIDKGADVNKPHLLGGRHQNLPLHIARSPEMCALLVKSGCPVNARSDNTFHESALHWGAQCGRPDIVLALLKLGAEDYNHPDAGSALDVAIKVRDKTSSVLGGNCWNPVATRLTVDMLTHPSEAKDLFPNLKV